MMCLLWLEESGDPWIGPGEITRTDQKGAAQNHRIHGERQVSEGSTPDGG